MRFPCPFSFISFFSFLEVLIIIRLISERVEWTINYKPNVKCIEPDVAYVSTQYLYDDWWCYIEVGTRRRFIYTYFTDQMKQ